MKNRPSPTSHQTMSSSPSELHFHGPYELCSETSDVLASCPLRDDHGVYLWAVHVLLGAYRVTYVGETGGSFYTRTKEHIIQTLGGNYEVDCPGAMLDGVRKPLWNGLWRKGSRDHLPEFLRRYEEFAPFIKKSLSIQRVFVAPFHGERRMRRRIEAALATALKKHPTAGSLLEDGVRYRGRGTEDKPVRVEVTADTAIDGLPHFVEA